METHLLWKAKEYPSLEYCSVKKLDAGWQISSMIVGMCENKIFRTEYLIKTNTTWETIYVAINANIAGISQSLNYSGDGKGKWFTEGKPADEFDGCIDIDIPLTPFTNTLPIKRLKLKNDQQHLIKVIYFDLIRGELKTLTQKYTKLSGTKYKYENVPNDFEAVITIDEEGFVIDYPGLFELLIK